MTTAPQTPGEPADVAALIALAQSEHRAGRFAKAVALYRQILVQRPELAEAHNNLGNALERLGKLDEAIAQYERALALDPSLYQANDNLGNILRKQGKLDQAVARYQKALVRRPDLAQAYGNLGKVLTEKGDFDRAAAWYVQAIALKPDFAEVHYDRAELKTFSAGDRDLAALEALAADARRLSPERMVYIHFALGKALEDVGQYGRAFEHWQKGNVLKRRQVDYDEAAEQRRLRRIAEVFDAQLLDRFASAGDPSPVPIFVLGMPRTGSTLVEQILASHPQIQGGGEMKHLMQLSNRVSDSAGRPIPYPEYVRELDADSWRQLGQAYLASLPKLAEGQIRITDKTPNHFAYIGLIRLILPNARIIHTVRDPVDTCLSCFSRLFTTGQPFSYDLAELGRYYRAYSALMTHWRAILPAGAMLDVAYEDVVNDLPRQARRLIEYCGLPWDDRCLDFHRTRRPIRTASNVQVRRPLYRGSIARWRRYEANLAPLLAELEGLRRAE